MNRITKILPGCLLAAAFFSAFACSGKTTDARVEKPLIAVSILPQQYFVERIAGGRVDALVLVGPGQNPHSYEPTPAQMASLARATTWVTSGTDFEIALEPKIAAQFPALTIVNGTDGVTFRELQEWEHESGEEHEDGEDPHGDTDHHDSNIDRHSWLGREPAKILAAHVRDALVLADPEGKEVYAANCESLIKDIDATYDDLVSSLASLRGKTVLVFHPSFAYFLDEFGIRQASVETGGKEPTAKTLAELVARAKADAVPAIFVQSQFPVRAAGTIASEAGAQVVQLDPLAPDWMDNIRRMGDALKNAYK